MKLIIQIEETPSIYSYPTPLTMTIVANADSLEQLIEANRNGDNCDCYIESVCDFEGFNHLPHIIKSMDDYTIYANYLKNTYDNWLMFFERCENQYAVWIDTLSNLKEGEVMPSRWKDRAMPKYIGVVEMNK